MASLSVPPYTGEGSGVGASKAGVADGEGVTSGTFVFCFLPQPNNSSIAAAIKAAIILFTKLFFI